MCGQCGSWCMKWGSIFDVVQDLQGDVWCGQVNVKVRRNSSCVTSCLTSLCDFFKSELFDMSHVAFAGPSSWMIHEACLHNHIYASKKRILWAAEHHASTAYIVVCRLKLTCGRSPNLRMRQILSFFRRTLAYWEEGNKFKSKRMQMMNRWTQKLAVSTIPSPS